MIFHFQYNELPKEVLVKFCELDLEGIKPLPECN